MAVALGKIGLALALLGFFAATFGAACETGLSVGLQHRAVLRLAVGQVRRARARPRRFHTRRPAVAPSLAVAVLLTTVDPIKVTEYSVVFSAVALPLTYFPILVVANDPDYMGEHVNGRLANALGTVYLVVIIVVVGRRRSR